MIDDYLEFKLIGNFWKIINKKGCFSFDQMTKGNNFNKWCFIPVSRCSGEWKKNINADYTLNYNEVTPLKKITTGDDGEEVRESVEYPFVEFNMRGYSNGGLTVQIDSATPIVEIGNVSQSMCGVFIVNKVTNVVLAFCILPEPFNVYNYLSFLYDGYVLEINNPVGVDKPSLSNRLDTKLEITLDKEEYYVDDIVSFSGVLTDVNGVGVSGATVVVDEVEYITNSNGEFSGTVTAVSDLALNVTFGGSSSYNSCSESVSVVVNKYGAVLSVSCDESSYYVDDVTTITVTLKDSNNNVINGVSISDGSTTRTTNSNGVATFTYNNESTGTMSKSYSFKGTSKYEECDKSVKWTVNKLNTTLTLSSDKSTYIVGSTAVVTATLKDVRGDPIPNASVNFGGSSLTTNSNGVVSKTYSNLEIDMSYIYCLYSGSEKYGSCNDSIQLNVVDKNVPVLSVSTNKSSYYVGDTTTVTCTLMDSDGSVMSGVSISDGSTSATTNSSGVATFTYSNTASGSVSKTFSYSGSSKYESASGKASWTVSKYNTTLTVSSDKSSYYVDDTATVTVTLKDSNGSVISGVSVSDGTTSKTTSSSGVATFTYLNSSSGSVSKSYSFSATSKYNASSGKVSWSVSKYDTVLSVTSDKSSYYVDDTATVSVTLKTSTGVAISGASIVFEDGSSITTNSSGVASKTFSCSSAGSVSKSLRYGGSTKYNSCTGSVGYTVSLKPTVTTLSASASSLNLGESVILTAKVTDSSGVPITTGSVTWDIDGGDWDHTDLDSNGETTITLSSDSAITHECRVFYDGNDTYDSSISDYVTVEWIDTPVTPELTLTAESLIGESGDTLPLTVESNLSSGTVSLVDSDTGTVYATGSIGSDGSATLEYNCTGLGDRNVVAQYIKGTDITTSNTLTIEDCLLYDPCTGSTVTDKWNTSGASYTTYKNTPCINIPQTDNWISSLFELPDDWSVTFKATNTNYWTWFRVMLTPLSNNDNSYNLVNLCSSYDARNSLINIPNFPYNSDYSTVKLVKQDNSITLYINDTLKGTATTDTSNKYFTMRSSYGSMIADVKLKSI